MKKILGIIPVISTLLILILCIGIISVYDKEENQISESKQESEISSQSKEKAEPTEATPENDNTEEMRGIWIPYMTLDISQTDRTKEQFTEKMNDILENCKNYKANTVIVHVRPFCDSIYPSEYFPFSHIISGTQGKTVNYDPLEIIVSLAHQKELKIHAWVNPLRVNLPESSFKLAENNPCNIWLNDEDPENDKYIMEYSGGKYLNPAYPEVRKLIINGIREIVQNYEVDGIQLDDYFYPSSDTDYDKASYEEYKKSVSSSGNALSQQEWRTANISTLVAGIYSAVHENGDNCIFGIAPECNTDNDKSVGADVYSWGSIIGYVDYLCPQIYVSSKHKTSPFNDLADKWRNLVSDKKVKLYFGLALYKAGTSADDGTWLNDDDMLKSQIEYSRKVGADGFMLYSYDYLFGENAANEVKNAMTVIN